MNTSEKLDHLCEIETTINNHYADVTAKRNILDVEKDLLLASILTDEQKQQMEDIKAEFAGKYAALDDGSEMDTLNSKAIVLQNEIREETIKVKGTTKGDKSAYQCVFTPESTKTVTTVKVDELKGMAKLMPKLRDLYTEEEKTTPANTSLRRK